MKYGQIIMLSCLAFYIAACTDQTNTQKGYSGGFKVCEEMADSKLASYMEYEPYKINEKEMKVAKDELVCDCMKSNSDWKLSACNKKPAAPSPVAATPAPVAPAAATPPTIIIVQQPAPVVGKGNKAGKPATPPMPQVITVPAQTR